jgi:hypothetical protein
MRSSKLTQIGKKTHFFDESHEDVFRGIKCIPGYQATIFNCESGLYLCVDTLNKFLKADGNCLARFYRDVQYLQQLKAVKPSDKANNKFTLELKNFTN